MAQLLIILLPILIADVINPVLLGGTIYTLGSRHPYVNTVAMLLGFFVTYLIAGLIIAVSLETLIDTFHIPLYFDYILELIVAGLLFYFAWKQYRQGDQHPEKKLKHDEKMTLWQSIRLGIQVNVVGLAFAIPYLAAIDQILKVEISVTATFFVLLLYNIVYVLPFALLIVIRRIYHSESTAIFETINLWMHRVYEKYMPIIFLMIGILLVEDAVSYLLGYREYSFLSLI